MSLDCAAARASSKHDHHQVGVLPRLPSRCCTPHNATGLLLVLPGAQPQADMKLDWAHVAASVEQLTNVTSYESFAAHWHGLYKHHRRVGSGCVAQ
jgi:hypothetical protein